MDFVHLSSDFFCVSAEGLASLMKGLISQHIWSFLYSQTFVQLLYLLSKLYFNWVDASFIQVFFHHI